MVIGTSLLIVLANTLSATGAHFLTSSIDLTLVAFLTMGSALGAFAGTRLLLRIKFGKSEAWVRYVYATVMSVIGIVMLTIKN